MPQPISMLDFRQKAGQVIDETFYLKKRWVITRKNKPVALLIPNDGEQRKPQKSVKNKSTSNVFDLDEDTDVEQIIRSLKPAPKKPYMLKLIGIVKDGPPDMSTNKRKYL